jgi:hypothetical protein
MSGLWDSLADEVGLEAAQQFYEHVSMTPGEPAKIGSTSYLRGKAGHPEGDGFSRTIHYEISGAGRINYQFNDAYTGGAHGDPHRVVRIRTIDHGSH